MLQGMMKGAWVVSVDWIEASKQQGRWLPEEPFEVKLRVPSGLQVCTHGFTISASFLTWNQQHACHNCGEPFYLTPL